MTIDLRSRDIKILKLVYACRVATYHQIARLCFGDRHRTTAYRRIRKLCDEGLLRATFAISDEYEQKYVEATERSWKFIREQWPFELNSPHFKSESPIHDLRFNEIVFKFEKLKTIKSFYTENLLQSSLTLAQDQSIRDLVKLQADGALVLNGSDGRTYTYGLEFEISKKNPERYREKIGSYYLARGIDGVIYVCSEREILNSLARIDKEVRQDTDSILYLGLETEVLKSQGKIFFQNAKEHAIELY